MNIREMRKQLGDTQSEFAARYNIPFRTVQNWETGLRKPPKYILDLLESRVKKDAINRRTTTIPGFDPEKKNLPQRGEYVGSFAWLKAVQKCLGDNVVFALDNALMCQERFGGRVDEYLVWIYGDDRAARYNGVIVLGNDISNYSIEEKDGIRFTDFNRTLSDSFDNEDILDFQGITEALSHYYYSHGESFDGVYVSPEHQERFKELADDAISYYDE